MTHEELFAAAIGIQSPWYIEDIQLDIPQGELKIKVNFKRGSKFQYVDEQTCKTGEYKAYDTQEKKWRHMNFFQYRCYLQAKIPRVKLEDGKIRQVKATWEGLSHGFTQLFEAFLTSNQKKAKLL